MIISNERALGIYRELVFILNLMYSTLIVEEISLGRPYAQLPSPL